MFHKNVREEIYSVNHVKPIDAMGGLRRLLVEMKWKFLHMLVQFMFREPCVRIYTSFMATLVY